jgi:HAE1 family hydrophobic/amphiphilic exporter-1
MASNNRNDLHGMIVSDTAIRQPVLVTMVMLLIIVLGGLAFAILPVNLFPDFNVTVVSVTMRYPGASPESVADQVAQPVEDEISGISGVEHITSRSSQGIAIFTVEFGNQVNADDAEQDVREAVNTALPDLPEQVEDPVYDQVDPATLPILSVAVTSEGTRTPLELRQLIDDEIVPRVQQVSGVGSVEVSGGRERQINVFLDLRELQGRAIAPSQVVNTIQRANTELGLGDIRSATSEINLRAPSIIQEPQDITELQLIESEVYLWQLADVEDGTAEVDRYARLNGEPAITLDIRKQSGTNTVEVADAARATLQQVFADYPELGYAIPQDSSDFVRETTRSALTELVVATLSAMFIVFIFFRNVRNTVVTVLGLPVILIGTFAALQVSGMTINIITLQALAVSVGLVIDDTIVVRENIFRHMERGEAPRQAASQGTAEVSTSVLAMTLTVIAVFVPIIFTQGTTGVIFQAFGITIASAVAISLVEAFTLAPVLSAYFFKQQQPKTGNDAKQAGEEHGGAGEEEKELSRVERGYERLLRWSLHHRLVIVGMAVLVFIASAYVAAQLTFSFLPQQDEGEFYMGFELPPGAPLEVTNELAERAEALLLEQPRVQTVQTTVGGGGNAERAEFFVKLEETGYTNRFIEEVRPKMDFLPDLSFTMPQQQNTSTDVTGRDIQLSLESAMPLDELGPLAQDVSTTIQQVSGLADLDSTYRPGSPELRFYARPSKLGDYNLTNDQIATSVRTLIDGTEAATFQKNGEEVPIVVRLRPGDRANVEDLQNISVPTPYGIVPLVNLVDVEQGSSPTTIRRYDRRNQVIIGANTEQGRNANEARSEITALLAERDLPAGVTTRFVGSAEDLGEGFQTLFIAMGLSVLFIYMVLASQFGSFWQPLVIMTAIPFSFVGAFLALRLLNLDLDITGMIGLILLLGLVVKNSLLLVDFTNRLRASDRERDAALARAGAVRLRPIMMTALSLIAGNLPIAIGLGEGSEVRRGLSVVVIGGMVSATLLTLLIVPTAYSLFDAVLQRIRRLFGQQQPSRVGEPTEQPAPQQQKQQQAGAD